MRDAIQRIPGLILQLLRWLSERSRGTWVLVIVLVAAGGLVALLVNGAGEILESIGDEEGIALWDRPVLDWAIGLRNPTLTAAMLWFTDTGGPIWQPIILAVVSLVLWWRWRDPTPVVLVLVVQVVAILTSLTAKNVIGRARPPQMDAVPPYETSPSFPSGHTLQAFAAAGIVCYLLIRHLWDRPAWQRVLIALFGLFYASVMAFSRVYLGYHWLTDVLAAAVLGLAWVAIVVACHRVWRTIRQRRADGPIEEEQARPAD